MFRVVRHVLVGVILALALFSSTVSTISAQETSPVSEEPGADVDPLPAAAEQVAEQTCLSFDDAYNALLRQPTIGQLQIALWEEGPPSFGGLLIEYEPQYQIVLLAKEGGGEEVRQAARDLAFDELDRFLVVRETPFTEDVLSHERDRVIELGADLVTTAGLDVTSGDILVTVATVDDENTLRARIEKTEPPIQARRVVIWQGDSQDEDSLGGLDTRINSMSQCTTGFSVKRLSDGVEGVAMAAHCSNGNRYITHHPNVILERVQGQDSGSLDVEWHKTPGLDDIKKIKWHENGSRWDVSGRVSRSSMSLGDYVCVYGAASNNYQCGTIKDKGYLPGMGSGGQHNSTFIRVDHVVNTTVGDSGAPWFLGGDAYGIHTGTTPCGEPGTYCYPYFMAQNYMGDLGIQVQITGS